MGLPLAMKCMSHGATGYSGVVWFLPLSPLPKVFLLELKIPFQTSKMYSGPIVAEATLNYGISLLGMLNFSKDTEGTFQMTY